MRLRMLGVVAVMVLLTCGEVSAVKRQFDLTVENLKRAGFAVSSRKGDDGAIDVTVTRDVSEARKVDPASDLELRRYATLEVQGESGLIVRCSLQPKTGDGVVSYRFQLAPGYVAHSRLTVSEVDDYKESLRREHLIGGGTIFTMRLSDFVKP